MEPCQCQASIYLWAAKVGVAFFPQSGVSNMILIQLCAPTVLIHADKFIDSSLSTPRNKSFINLCCMGGAREMVWFVGLPGATVISLISHKHTHTQKMKSKTTSKMESPKT